MSAIVVGLDWPGALAMVPEGVDFEATVGLLRAAETGAMIAIRDNAE